MLNRPRPTQGCRVNRRRRRRRRRKEKGEFVVVVVVVGMEMQLHAFVTSALDGDGGVTPWARKGDRMGLTGRAGCSRVDGCLGNRDVTQWIIQTRV